jgi:hypothetical protein
MGDLSRAESAHKLGRLTATSAKALAGYGRLVGTWKRREGRAVPAREERCACVPASVVPYRVASTFRTKSLPAQVVRAMLVVDMCGQPSGPTPANLGQAETRCQPDCTTPQLRAGELLPSFSPPRPKQLTDFGMFLLHLSETLFAPDGLSSVRRYFTLVLTRSLSFRYRAGARLTSR